VTAIATGFEDTQEQVAVKEGQAVTVVLSLRRIGEAAPMPVAPPSPASAPVSPAVAPAPVASATLPAEDSRMTERGRTLAYVGFSVAGAGLLVGSFTGLASWKRTNDLQSVCGSSVCPPNREDDISGAKTLANVSNVAFGIAVVGTGVGLYGLLFDRETARIVGGAAGAPRVRAVAGPGSVAVVGAF
jgi:hypothetical protein